MSKLLVTPKYIFFFTIGLDVIHHKGTNELRKINWDSKKERVKLRIDTIFFKHCEGVIPS